jgi:hypothetical protein
MIDLYKKGFDVALMALAILMIQNATLLKQLSDNFEKYAPICFFYGRETKRSKQISTTLRKFYLGDEPLSNASLSGLLKMYKDVVGIRVDRAVQLISRMSPKPVYYYEFAY